MQFKVELPQFYTLDVSFVMMQVWGCFIGRGFVPWKVQTARDEAGKVKIDID